MRKSLIMMAIVGGAAATSGACATKGFVRTQVAQVNEKVDSVNQSLEATQERTKQNEGRIGEVDQKAAAANSAAGAAQISADMAGQRASAANDAANTVAGRAAALEASNRRLMFEVVISENQGNFKFGQSGLPDEAKAKLDALVAQLKADPKGAYFEIEGHTDNTGAKTTNEKLGMARADAVKKYLYEAHQIPLHRMNVISFGEDKPLAPNDTREGRAQNRAVVIRVLV